MIRRRRSQKAMRLARSWACMRHRSGIQIIFQVAALRARWLPIPLRNLLWISRWMSCAIVTQDDQRKWYDARGILGWRGIIKCVSGGARFWFGDSHAKGRCAFWHTEISLRAESIIIHVYTTCDGRVCVLFCPLYSNRLCIHSSIHAYYHLDTLQGLCAQLTTALGMRALCGCDHLSSPEGCAFRELRLKR